MTRKTIGHVYSASGPVLVRFFADWTRPVITDRTRPSVRSKVLARPNASGQSWSDSLCVRSLSAVGFKFDRCYRPDASGHVDRRVRSVRKILSWHITVRIDCGVYKYIPSTSYWGLFLICSAEKHFSSARKCKSSSEGCDLRIQVWNPSLVTRE
jgi:hypothetical protein